MKARSIALRALRLVVFVPLPFVLAACTSPSDASGSSGSPGALGSTAASADPAHSPELVAAPRAIRKVTHRSPYGDVAATHNLVLDGDFELEQDPSSSQWLLFNADGSYGTLAFLSGGRCRSGLYCVDALGGQYVYALQVAIAPGTAGTFTFAAKPAGACSDAQGELDLSADVEGTMVDAFDVQPTSAQPGADGWCTYEVSYTADRPMYQWTQAVLWSASETVFDDVVVQVAPAARAVSAERRTLDLASGSALAARRRAAAELRARKGAAVLNPHFRPGDRRDRRF